MILVRLIYCSIQNGVGDADIINILDTARANNALDRVTGALVYNGKYFLQILEGNRMNVTRRFISIVKDCRHKDIELLDFSPIKERRFPRWEIQYVGASDIDHEIVSTYTTGELDPTRMIFIDGIIEMVLRLVQ